MNNETSFRVIFGKNRIEKYLEVKNKQIKKV